MKTELARLNAGYGSASRRFGKAAGLRRLRPALQDSLFFLCVGSNVLVLTGLTLHKDSARCGQLNAIQENGYPG